MHAVRKHILDILKEREGATVAELADALEMAAVSVRHHLDILQGDNLIKVARVERKGSVGRPQQIYVLTEEAAEIVESVFNTIKDTLERGEKIKISGFGNFVVRDKKARIGRNPQTGEEITIAARRVLNFKPSQVLKNVLNGQPPPA